MADASELAFCHAYQEILRLQHCSQSKIVPRSYKPHTNRCGECLIYSTVNPPMTFSPLYGVSVDKREISENLRL
jgi:hypothetical protein